jgi:hypothetical protein
MPSARRPSVTFKLTHHRRVPPQTLTARHRNGDLWEPRGATLRTGPPVSHSSSKRFGVTTPANASAPIDFPDLTVAIVGNNAIVRHLWVSESELDGKVTNTKVGVLQVWQKQDSSWKLLARASFKLPPAA